MTKIYTRKLSFNERVFLAAAALSPPMANQMVFEGRGRLDYPLLQKAVEIASEANPGSRLILRGILGGCRWVDSGATPPVIEIPHSRWTGYDSDNAPYLEKPFNPKQGPTCEVVLVQGDPVRVIFRSLHGVMDGRGTFIWAEEVFRALRGESCIGSRSIMTDTELARSFQKRYRRPYSTEHLPPTGASDMNETGFAWRRARVTVRPHSLVGQIALQTAREAWRYADGIVRFGIPVDMRPRMPGLLSTANLTFAIYIQVKKDSTPELIAEDISLQLKEKREGMLSREDDLIRYIPLSLIGRMGNKVIAKRHQSGIFSISGFISNFGKLDLKKYSGGGFECTGIFTIPPASDYVPFFIVVAGYENAVELILALPRKLSTNNRLDLLLDKIASSIH